MSSELDRLPRLGERRNLADAVYDQLREAITSGVFAAGYRLREIPLAQHFGVSTTPVREALRRLEREGLVEISPNRGAVVPRYEVDEIRDLYEIREVLESRAVRRAAEARTKDLSEVARLLAEAAEVVDEPDQVRFNALDVEFHQALNELGGNLALADMAVRVQRQIQSLRVRLAVHLPGRPRLSHADHLEIVEAVRQDDADLAEAVLCRHIASVREAVLGALREDGRRQG